MSLYYMNLIDMIDWLMFELKMIDLGVYSKELSC